MIRGAAVLGLVAAAAAARGASADGARLTLHDVLVVAVRRNPSLALDAARTAIAGARTVEAAGAFDPVFDAQLSSGASRKDPNKGLIFQQLQQDGATASAGVTDHLPGGGTLSLHLEAGTSHAVSRLSQNGRDVDGTSDLYQPALRLGLVQPLWRGRGRVAQAGVDRAHAERTAAGLEREAAADDLVRDLVTAYWELVLARQELDIRRASVGLAHEQLRIVQLAIRLGKQPDTAVAEVEVELGLREEDALVADSAVTERSLELRRLAGLDLGPGEIAIEPADPPGGAAGPELPDLDEALRRALRGPRLAALEAHRRSASIDLAARHDALRPQLDLKLDVAATGSDAGAIDALGRMAGYGGVDARAALVFSMPLGGNAARGARDAARGELLAARVREADVSAQLTVAVVRAVDDLRLARKRSEVLARSTGLAETNLATENRRFEAGGTTSFEVLKRQAELAQARLRRARAQIDQLEATARLEALTGEILARHGIALVTAD